MKLKELMIMPEKPLKEIFSIVTLGGKENAVEVSVDDVTVHITGGEGIADLKSLHAIVQALSRGQLFKKIIHAHGQNDGYLEMVLTPKGLLFR